MKVDRWQTADDGDYGSDYHKVAVIHFILCISHHYFLHHQSLYPSHLACQRIASTSRLPSSAASSPCLFTIDHTCRPPYTGVIIGKRALPVSETACRYKSSIFAYKCAITGAFRGASIQLNVFILFCVQSSQQLSLIILHVCYVFMLSRCLNSFIWILKNAHIVFEPKFGTELRSPKFLHHPRQMSLEHMSIELLNSTEQPIKVLYPVTQRRRGGGLSGISPLMTALHG